MAKIDEKYHKLLKKIIKDGYQYEDPNRKDIFRTELTDYQIKYNFKDGFPILTTKEISFRNIVVELLWFLRGDTNIKYLIDNGCNIWNKDAYNYFLKYKPTINKSKGFNNTETILFEKNNEQHYNLWLGSLIQGGEENLWFGNLGRIYGAQWRKWQDYNTWSSDDLEDAYYTTEVDYLDQITNLINNLKSNPMSTSHIVTAWNPAELDNMALPPCHWSFQIVVRPLNLNERRCIYGKLAVFNEDLNNKNIPKYGFKLIWNQRSVDTFLGLPYNIASYALLTHIIGKMVNMKPLGIVGNLANVHIYNDHIDAVNKQLKNDINKYDSCELEIKSKKLDINNLNIDDFVLNNYSSYPKINATMFEYNK